MGEGDKVESLFIIGFLEYKKSGNYPPAFEYLNRVIEFGSANAKYDLLVNAAEKYVAELEALMATHQI